MFRINKPIRKVKHIGYFGKIKIPRCMRKQLHLHRNNRIEITLIDDVIILKKLSN